MTQPDDATEPGRRRVPLFLAPTALSPVSGVDADHRQPILEVHQLWGDRLLDTRHFTDEAREVTMGGDIGWRWSMLGVDLGLVPRALVTPLRYAPPLLSEVDAAWTADFQGPESWLDDHHQLFTRVDDGWVAHVPAGWTAVRTRDGSDSSLAHLVADGQARVVHGDTDVAIALGDTLVVDQGDCRFVARLVSPSNRTRVAPPPDLPFAAVLSAVAAIGALFGLIVALSPPPAATTVLELPASITEVVFQAPPPQPEPESVTAAPSKPDDEGRARPDSKGRSGRKDAKLAESRGKRGSLSKQQADRAVVANSGVLGVLAQGVLSDGVFGSDVSPEIVAAIGGLKGPSGTRLGTGGLHDRGDGFGADGDVEGTGIGLQGDGPGANGRCAEGPCDPNGDLGDRRVGNVGGTGNPPTIIGHYPKDLIDEVVKRNMQRIRYCYQRELSKDPTLGGKIVTKFVIAKDGSVSSASTKSSTVANQAVESCIAGKFQQMTFPAPQTGIVVVAYPFLFSPG